MLQVSSLFKQLKWLVLLIIAIALLFWGLPAKTVKAESITITPPSGKTNFILAVETAGQSLIDTTGLVTSDVNYDVLVKDKMDGKPSGDAGQMVEWTGTAWGDSKLASVVTVISNHTSGTGVKNVTASDQVIISNALPATDDDLKINIMVNTVSGDTVLPADHWYKIILTFTASAHT